MSRRLMARTHTVQIEPMAAWLDHPRDSSDSMKTGGTSATAAARRCTELSLRVGGNKGSSLTGACTINRTLITMHD